MSLAVAIQMDPIDTIDIDADSTFALALEAQARGHALFHYLPEALSLHDGRLYARARPLEVFRQQGHHHRFGPLGLYTATHLLELLPDDGSLVVNDPTAVRDAPSKAVRAALQGADAADLAVSRPRHDPRVLERARRHHCQAVIRQWRCRGVPAAAGRREPDRAIGNV